jgi:DNA-binding response OmpR family regulator
MARILVVDDEPSFAGMLHDLLTDEGYQVTTHSDGATAFATIRRHKPDLVILDMNLGDPEGGWVVLDGVRLDQATANIPVIICSAHERFLQDHAAELREAGCCLLAKPFAVDDLIALIKRALMPGSRACRELFEPLPRSSPSNKRR